MVTADEQDRPVRWGGLLYATWVEESQSCLELIALPLDEKHRPDVRNPLGGRFLACQDHAPDPEEFVPGRQVTVVGVFERIAEVRVGEAVHRFPIVSVRSVHAWPVPPRYRELEPWGRNTSSRSNRSPDASRHLLINRAINNGR